MGVTMPVELPLSVWSPGPLVCPVSFCCKRLRLEVEGVSLAEDATREEEPLLEKGRAGSPARFVPAWLLIFVEAVRAGADAVRDLGGEGSAASPFSSLGRTKAGSRSPSAAQVEVKKTVEGYRLLLRTVVSEPSWPAASNCLE